MKTIFSVELTEEYVKVAVAKQQGIHSKVDDCIVEPVTGLSDEAIADVISGITKKKRYKPNVVTVSLARNFVTVRNLNLPSQEKSEITKMIELHIDRIVPYKREDVIFNYHLAGMDEAGYQRVIVAIAHSEIVRRRIRIIDKAGFLVDGIVLSSYGIWQWIINHYKAEMNQTDVYLALDIDTTFTDCVIFSKDHLLFTRSLGVKAADANDEEGLKKFLGELRQSLLIFQNKEMNKKPALIFLSGVVNAALPRVIEREFDIKAKEVIHPLSSEAVSDKKYTHNVSCTSVVDLALRENVQRLMFVLPDIQMRKALKEKIKELVVLGSAVICLFAVLAMFLLGKRYHDEVYLSKLQARYVEMKEDTDILLRQEEQVRFVNDYLRVRRLPLFIINQLQKMTSQNVSFTSINIDEGNRITLNGRAYQSSDVSKLLVDLESTGFFKDIEKRYTRQRKVEEQVLTDFGVEFVFNADMLLTGETAR